MDFQSPDLLSEGYFSPCPCFYLFEFMSLEILYLFFGRKTLKTFGYFHFHVNTKGLIVLTSTLTFATFLVIINYI